MSFMPGTREQAQENAQRNGRGDPGSWFQHKADYRPPPGQPRVRPEAREIAEKNKPTISSTLHEFKAKEDPEKPPVRLRDQDAVHNFEKGQFESDQWYDFGGNLQYRPKSREPHVYHQGAEVLEMNNQQRQHDWFDHTKAPEEEVQPGPKCYSELGKSIATRDHAIRRDTHDLLTHDHRREGQSRPVARVTANGQEYADRNRYGSASQWMGDGVGSQPAYEPDNGPLQPRCPSSQATENYERSKGAAMQTCFDYRGAQPDPAPNARVRGEAAEQAYKQNRGSLGSAASRPPAATPAPRAVKPEAQETYYRNQGSMNMILDQSQNKNYQEPKPQPRVKGGAGADNAQRNAGMMGSCLSKTDYRAPPHDHRVHPRGGGTGDAQANASAAKGSSTKTLLENSRLPPDPPPKARVANGEEYADRNKGSVGGVLGGYGRHAPDEPPGLRVRPGAAAENMERNRGTGLFKVIQQNPPSYRE